MLKEAIDCLQNFGHGGGGNHRLLMSATPAGTGDAKGNAHAYPKPILWSVRVAPDGRNARKAVGCSITERLKVRANPTRKSDSDTKGRKSTKVRNGRNREHRGNALFEIGRKSEEDSVYANSNSQAYMCTERQRDHHDCDTSSSVHLRGQRSIL